VQSFEGLVVQGAVSLHIRGEFLVYSGALSSAYSSISLSLAYASGYQEYFQNHVTRTNQWAFCPSKVDSVVELTARSRRFWRRGGEPVFFERARDLSLFDVDCNLYHRLHIGAWGPMILGHAHPKGDGGAGRTQSGGGQALGAPTEAESEPVRSDHRSGNRPVGRCDLVNSGPTGHDAAPFGFGLHAAFGYSSASVCWQLSWNVDSLLVAQGVRAARWRAVPNSPGVTKGTGRTNVDPGLHDPQGPADGLSTAWEARIAA